MIWAAEDYKLCIGLVPVQRSTTLLITNILGICFNVASHQQCPWLWVLCFHCRDGCMGIAQCRITAMLPALQSKQQWDTATYRKPLNYLSFPLK